MVCLFVGGGDDEAKEGPGLTEQEGATQNESSTGSTIDELPGAAIKPLS